jgi:nitrile hydratase
LKNGTAACEELGLEIPALKLVVVENTPQVHNVIVCTLCSCYPRVLLGIPPDWYKSRAYRSRMVREPRAVLAEFGLSLPDKTAIRVHDSTADMRYLVLPMRPAGSEGWDEARLASLVSRDSMIGVAQPAPG